MNISRRLALKSALSPLGVGALALQFPVALQAQSPLSGPQALVKVALIEALSGPFANTGEAVFRNMVWAFERVSAAGAGLQAVRFKLDRYDNKGQVEEALSALRAAIDDGAQVILQGNSSAVAAALIDAVNKHNEREPARRVLYLNYSAVDPSLTNEKCSPWHFRFDAHADMRMRALMSVLAEDASLKTVYLFGQDYSFGQSVLREAKRQLPLVRSNVRVVGEELHPLGRIKDFAPYALKIKSSGAHAVVTGNWGNDLTLLVKAAREVGYEGSFYTFYGNALGAPTAMGDAGVGKVIAVADWLPNVEGPESEAFYQSFKKRFPNPADDYVHMRMQLMVLALAESAVADKARQRLDVLATQLKLKSASVRLAGQGGFMRGDDGQFQQSLVVGVMGHVGSPGIKFGVEGTGYGFRVIKAFNSAQAQLPHTCTMALAA